MIIKFLQSPDAEQERGRSRIPSTCAGGNSAATGELMEAVSTGEPSHIVAAHLTEQDYRLAKSTIPEMGAFEDYDDWLDFRTGDFFWS